MKDSHSLSEVPDQEAASKLQETKTAPVYLNAVDLEEWVMDFDVKIAFPTSLPSNRRKPDQHTFNRLERL